MNTLPASIVSLLEPFERMFSPRTWLKAQTLAIGAMLAPGKRTVTSALRVMGMGDRGDFSVYHQVLNRARWSPLKISRVLLMLLIDRLDSGEGPLVFGMDDTVERRWGKRIAAKGIYHDAPRSSRSHFAKTTGIRWLSLMWLSDVPWAERVWALPFLTVLAPSERYHRMMGRRHKRLVDFAMQMLVCLRRWLPDRDIVVVADRSYAALRLLSFCQKLRRPITLVTRLRMDAALYAPAHPCLRGQRGRPRVVGDRQPRLSETLADPDTNWTAFTLAWYDSTVRTMEIASGTAVWSSDGRPRVHIRWVIIRDPEGDLDDEALLCTDPYAAPEQIVEWFTMRWQVEVTFQEARAHVGVQTQRQWSDLAIARTTPALFGLFSMVALMADALAHEGDLIARASAWYSKRAPTFSDAIAAVRRRLWSSVAFFSMSHHKPDMLKIPRQLYDTMMDSLCYAA